MNSLSKKHKKMYNQNGAALFFLLPWLIGLFTMTLGPMLASVYYSFTNYNLLSKPSLVGINNYETLIFSEPVFHESIKITFVFVILSTVLKLTFALAVAMLLNKGLRGLGLYRTIFYIPSLLGGSVAIAMLWRNIFSGSGLLNRILGYIGINAPDWINNPKYSIYTLVALSVWQFGSSMVIFLAGLKQVPAEYYEASSIDGAGKVRQFISITLPSLSPIIFFNVIMQTIRAFQAFTPAFVISGGTGGPLNSTMLYSLYLYLQGFAYMHMGFASAMAWLLVVLIGVFITLIFISSKWWVHHEDGGGII